MNNIDPRTTDVLDSEYTHGVLYKELIICSNHLINTNYVFTSEDDWHPLVIRKGKTPRVWLSVRHMVKVDSQEELQYLDLIVDSELKHPNIFFTKSVHGFQIK
jgi:hypothetical protein